MVWQPLMPLLPIDPIFSSPLPDPFGVSTVGLFASPALVDIDRDGDLDLFIGNNVGQTLFFRNIAQAGNSEPTFAEPITNPFGIGDVGYSATPTFVDIDGDGDLDLFAGEFYGNIRFFRNEASPGSTTPAFAAGQLNPFFITDSGDNSAPTFADLDGDGDLDLYIGTRSGTIRFLRNIGSATNPSFTAGPANPFGISSVGSDAKPKFIDLDGDGDLDLFVSNSAGTTFFFRNTGSTTAPGFATPVSNPFGIENVGTFAVPSLGDLDGDGDVDLLLGTVDGRTFFFRNTVPPPPNTVNGTDGNDVLVGSQTADLIQGFIGNDRLEGRAGNDTLDGGSGNDAYVFDTDTALGSDRLVDTSTTGIDTLDFSTTSTRGIFVDLRLTTPQTVNANLTLTVAEGSRLEHIIGGSLNDTLNGNLFNNSLHGLAGNDNLAGHGGNDTLVGGGGNDTLNGGSNNDLYVFDTDSPLGSDTLIEASTAGVDTLDFSTTSTRNVVVDLRLTTAQTVNAGLILKLAPGSRVENIFGGSLNDTLTGNLFNNNLQGRAGNDILQGFAGNDLLAGGTGLDTLAGGAGNDTLIGGTGADRFRFDAALNADTNRDTITDFSVAQGDRIELENVVFTTLTTTGTLAAAAFGLGATATSAAQRILYNSATGLLAFDRDGNGTAAPIAFATLSPGLALTNASFTVT
jgi:Ca2+-binding RTX toxin-like protein